MSKMSEFLDELHSGSYTGETVPYFLYGSRSKFKPWPKYNLSFVNETYAKENSDWDYAIPSSLKSLYTLEGDPSWVKIEGYYPDGSTTAIFEKDFDDGVIQLSLRSNYSEFFVVWSSIEHEFYGKFFFKDSPDYLGKEGVTRMMEQFYKMRRVEMRHFI